MRIIPNLVLENSRNRLERINNPPFCEEGGSSPLNFSKIYILFFKIHIRRHQRIYIEENYNIYRFKEIIAIIKRTKEYNYF